MIRRIILQRLAVNDLDEAYHRAHMHAPTAATRWLNRFEASLTTLAENAERCPFAREHEKVDLEVREFLFGRKPSVYRVIFTIEGDLVRVLRILLAQRRFLTKQQISDALEAGE